MTQLEKKASVGKGKTKKDRRKAAKERMEKRNAARLRRKKLGEAKSKEEEAEKKKTAGKKVKGAKDKEAVRKAVARKERLAKKIVATADPASSERGPKKAPPKESPGVVAGGRRLNVAQVAELSVPELWQQLVIQCLFSLQTNVQMIDPASAGYDLGRADMLRAHVLAQQKEYGVVVVDEGVYAALNMSSSMTAIQAGAVARAVARNVEAISPISLDAPSMEVRLRHLHRALRGDQNLYVTAELLRLAAEAYDGAVFRMMPSRNVAAADEGGIVIDKPTPEKGSEVSFASGEKSGSGHCHSTQGLEGTDPEISLRGEVEFVGAPETMSAGGSGRPPSEPPGLPPSDLPGPAGSVPPGMAPLRREPRIQFQPLVEEGETRDLIVKLDEVTAQTVAERVLEFKLETGETEVKVHVTLDAPGFEVLPTAGAEMVVKAQRMAATEKVIFKLTAFSPGAGPVTREIAADFWVGHACVGSVTYRTVVVPKGHGLGDGGVRSDGFEAPARQRISSDLVIALSSIKEKEEPPFKVSLSCTLKSHPFQWKPCGTFDLRKLKEPDKPAKTLEGYLETIYDKMFESYPHTGGDDWGKRYAAWAAQANDHLVGVGVKLWGLLPETFRQEYLRLVAEGAQIESISVHSGEMIFPWELVIPPPPEGEVAGPQHRLGQRYLLGRWRPGRKMRPVPQRLRVGRFCVLNPTYPGPPKLRRLMAAEKEALTLKERFPQAVIIRPGDLESVRAELLRRLDCHVFHFSGHGSFHSKNADLSKLDLEEGEITGVMFKAWQFGTRDGPLVFLNACQAGSAGAVVGGSGGFAATFLECGCSGVIAPYWPVEDSKASEFALALYEKLATGMVIGRALRELRRKHPERPSYAAFAFFGDPYASLDLRGVQ